jgi:hypothetical protein
VYSSAVKAPGPYKDANFNEANLLRGANAQRVLVHSLRPGKTRSRRASVHFDHGCLRVVVKVQVKVVESNSHRPNRRVSSCSR